MRSVSKKRAAELRKRRRIIERMKADGPVLCARCQQRADDLHELLSRARGGSVTDPENLRPLCRPCHDFVTTHPVEAAAEGWSLGKKWTPEKLAIANAVADAYDVPPSLVGVPDVQHS